MNKLLEDVQKVAVEAGYIQMSYFGKDLKQYKKKDNSVFTDADKKTEDFIIRELEKAYPEIGTYSEENSSTIYGNNKDYWVIDPLDGTDNFLHRIPHFCVSIALYSNNNIVLGVVYDPVSKELFSALKGQGAFLNGEPIKVSKQESIENSFLVLAYSYYKQKTFSIFDNVYAIRFYGAAALDLAYVACGRFDGLIGQGLYFWDVAAGNLLVQEAGGKTSDFNAKIINKDFESILASNSYLYDGLLKFLQK